MSYIRTLKPEFFRSESVAQLPLAARLTFAGLWTEADGQGRGVANAKVLKGSLWSLDDEIGPRDVEAHLLLLDQTQHIKLYEVEGKRYFVVLNWENHQSAALRRHPSKLPDPPPAQSGIIGQDASCQKVPYIGIGIVDRNSNTSASGSTEVHERAFQECWENYPRKEARKDAYKAYLARRREGIPASTLTRAVVGFAKRMSEEGRSRTKIMMGKTFFGPNERWRDYLDAPNAPPSAPMTGGGDMFTSEDERSAFYGDEIVELPGETQ